MLQNAVPYTATQIPSLLRPLHVARLVLREVFAQSGLEREPEPQVMDEVASVAAFHAQGHADGALVPIYQINAKALSRMLPLGGTLLDLGSGSGRFLAFLARRRPDVKIIGVDLSEEMTRVGRRQLDKEGLSNQVELRSGDMTKLDGIVDGHVDVVSAIYSLHHLPDHLDLERCVGAMARLRERTGCGVWIFDHVRPRRKRTAEEFPFLFSPEGPDSFKKSSRDSLLASFSYAELRACLQEAMREKHRSIRSHVLRLFQAHWLTPKSKQEAEGGDKHWIDQSISAKAVQEYRGLRSIMRGLPVGNNAS